MGIRRPSDLEHVVPKPDDISLLEADGRGDAPTASAHDPIRDAGEFDATAIVPPDSQCAALVAQGAEAVAPGFGNPNVALPPHREGVVKALLVESGRRLLDAIGVEDERVSAGVEVSVVCRQRLRRAGRVGSANKLVGPLAQAQERFVVEDPHLARGVAADAVDGLAPVRTQRCRDRPWRLPGVVVAGREGQHHRLGVADIEAAVAEVAPAAADRHVVVGADRGGATERDRDVDQRRVVANVHVVIGHMSIKADRHGGRLAVFRAIAGAALAEGGEAGGELDPGPTPLGDIVGVLPMAIIPFTTGLHRQEVLVVIVVGLTRIPICVAVVCPAIAENHFVVVVTVSREPLPPALPGAHVGRVRARQKRLPTQPSTPVVGLGRVAPAGGVVGDEGVFFRRGDRRQTPLDAQLVQGCRTRLRAGGAPIRICLRDGVVMPVAPEGLGTARVGSQGQAGLQHLHLEARESRPRLRPRPPGPPRPAAHPRRGRQCPPKHGAEQGKIHGDCPSKGGRAHLSNRMDNQK